MAENKKSIEQKVSPEYLKRLTPVEFRDVVKAQICPVRRCVMLPEDAQHPAETVCIVEYYKEIGKELPVGADPSKCLKSEMTRFAASQSGNK